MRQERDLESRRMWRGMGEAWNALGTIVGGIAIWGGVGYGIDRLVGTKPVLFVIGVLVGNFASIYLIYVKYFRDVPNPATPWLDAPNGAPSRGGPPDAS
ncbi:MAG TPA: AtpZ/AtpI family protein [Actinomycetota bacterium]|nr:AtpZ/AtpI family protein [Actinomycetota bacterium]